MLEPILLDAPVVFPYACVCGSQKGPILDTHIEVYDRRIYLCQLCAKTHARIFGFVSGERMEQLSHANELLTERERNVAVLLEENTELTDRLEIETRRAEELVQKISDLEAYIARVQTEIREASGSLVATLPS